VTDASSGSAPASARTAELAERGAAAAVQAFDAYQEEFLAVTRRARQRFAHRDWRGSRADAMERLGVRARHVRDLADRLHWELEGQAGDRDLWAAVKPLYRARIARRPDVELAESFFNSASRRILGTLGIDPRVEFVAGELAAPLPDPGRPVFRTYAGGPTESLLRRALEDADVGAAFRDLEGDDVRAARKVDRFLGRAGFFALDVLRPVFYRGKGAYLVGRARQGAVDVPLLLALLHEEGGVRLDAVLLEESQAAVVFSFARSNFHVASDRPRAVVDFLRTILPRRRLSDLYAAIGYREHARMELHREILAHLEGSLDRFEPVRGDRGAVMAVFGLPSLDVVFKVIRDRLPPPRAASREEVMRRYELVLRHDRAGRLPDAQPFEHLVFPRARFDPRVLEELLAECAGTVRLAGDQVHVRHLFAERRVTPLKLFLRETDPESARLAVVDLGAALRDLAATNTFPGDLRLENFGITRTGRVVFYDYDGIRLLGEVTFRDGTAAPAATGAEGEVDASRLLDALELPASLREPFVAAHGELLTAAFWRSIQDRNRAGEIVDVFPYREGERLEEEAP
jgi:isocitrate dehydrogenase kinase/phosphatase